MLKAEINSSPSVEETNTGAINLRDLRVLRAFMQSERERRRWNAAADSALLMSAVIPRLRCHCALGVEWCPAGLLGVINRLSGPWIMCNSALPSVLRKSPINRILYCPEDFHRRTYFWYLYKDYFWYNETQPIRYILACNWVINFTSFIGFSGSKLIGRY